MKLRLFYPLLLVIALVCGLSSCNSSEPDSGTQIYLDIVTVRTIDPAGTTLTLREGADTPLVTYTTTQPISGDFIKVGDRILISYTAANGRFVDGPITIYGSTVTIGKGAEIPLISSEDLTTASLNGVNMNSAWRTGEYVNVVFISRSAPTPKKAELVLDESTLSNDYPDVYLLYQAENSGEVSDYAFYMSYSVAGIPTANPNAKGITLRYRDEYSNEQQITINILNTGDQPRPGL